MRYYILTRTTFTDEWWVLAETGDLAWAKDEALTWSESVVLSEEEALLDPDFQGAVQRWQARDDGALHADMAMGEAEDAVRVEAWKELEPSEIADITPHPAAARAREAPWFSEYQGVRVAGHHLVFSALRELAKVNVDVARSATGHLAREFRGMALNDEFWGGLVSIPDEG